MTSLFVFDFDGVLFDTARECLELAYATVREDPARWDVPAAFVAPEQPTAAVADIFRRYRYHVGPPWQFAVLLGCIARGRVPEGSADFLAIANAHREQMEPFTKRYFASRAHLAGDRPRWLSLIEPVRPVLDVFVRLRAQGNAAVLSTRDDDSITTLLTHYTGVGLSRSELLPRSGPLEKWEILLRVAQEREIAPARIFFLDDYLQHALPAFQHGVSARLATWGYLGPHDVEDARAGGLPQLSQSQLDTAVRNHEENRT